MLISYKWLKDYVDIEDIAPEEIADRLTTGGVEVDALYRRSEPIEGCVVGYVVEAKKHPDADSLNICQVDQGAETVQIICGADNVAAGQKVVVAKPGTVLPGGMEIKATDIRGQESNGMICSLQELGMEAKLVPKHVAEGIFVFDENPETGSDAIKALGWDDTVMDLDITPNRADCLNVLGVAYEVAAQLDRTVKLPRTSVKESDKSASAAVNVKIENGEDTPYYGARVAENIQVKPSPYWMQNRLMAAGIRPISNIVDITNYVLLEYGQPLHAFDFDAFGSDEVLVRRAFEDEEIQTLDGNKHHLSSAHLVVTNGTKPTALAGVMGGEHSEVGDGTTNILLEAALFHPSLIRQASKDTRIRSDASVRYERGLDTERVEQAADRAAYLFAEHAGASILQGIEQEDHRKPGGRWVTVSDRSINQLLGMELSGSEMVHILERLGFQVADKETGSIEVYIPSRRPDIHIEEDVAEEIARMHGYQDIPSTLPKGATTAGSLTAEQKRKRTVRRFLESAGLSEAVTYSLTTAGSASRFTLYPEKHTMEVTMPMSEDRRVLRQSLIPQLLEGVSYNRNRQTKDIALFEMGSVFLSEEERAAVQPEERIMLAAVVSGRWESHLWQGETKRADFYVIKGIAEGILEELHVESRASFTLAERSDMHPGRTADIQLDGETVGYVGQIHPTTAGDWDIAETYALQVDLTSLLQAAETPVRYQALPRFPSTTRDIAIVVDESVPAADVKNVIEAAGGSTLYSTSLFDVYQGENLTPGKKSLAFTLVYLDPERTLTDEEVTSAHDQVLRMLEEKTGAELRQ
ncbi:phenylalanine--tRNA ligase subunit beta [Marinococcus halophilus]|uniref:Phenylalanine--tRNA ligase beta subunit n=1 Tax=Marinococcus halophilus TaxID=1371 RepID=A0A510Y454_MARHA|nr:phenylalanine--tRNA ligase subunit beta [Marinococcus halophilus]OZT79979.1 phenylalanine--tRNA ligase subunit beta [Marinococcus halophilus]GEK58102.1 phenylalanine--tRNA ligase beta subunit [Marinococcus halophilus]